MGRQTYIKILLLQAMVAGAWSHARFSEPPSRASMWRYGYDTPHDYNDHQGNCGGSGHQHGAMGGACGICGDPWDERPRQHEVGGRYATGTITRTYAMGSVIDVAVDVTANHRGRFEFRICPTNDPNVEATQTCLNQYYLFMSNGSTYYYLDEKNGEHRLQVVLPRHLTCSHCVMQWIYVAGNSWGMCEDGSGGLGCGPQEEFRGCADVAIVRSGAPQPILSTTEPSIQLTSTNRPISNSSPTPVQTTTSTFRPTTSPVRTPAPAPTTCRAVGVWAGVPGMDTWCDRNCRHQPPHCPASHCSCA